MCHANFRGRRRLALFLVFISMFLAGIASAAGNYSQDFSSGAPNWVAASGTWQTVAGHYENSTADAPLMRAIAYYAGDSWATDYTFKASLNADWTGTNGANKIGVVFNYTDSVNYHEVLIDMLGNVWLNSVVNGARSTIASGQVSASAVPGIDQWFDVTVSRSGNSVAVSVGSEAAIPSTALSSLPAGRIGVFTHYNHGLFDNISVTVNSYTQDFSSGAPGWVAASGVWQAVSGHYENSTGDAPLLRAISYYSGATWATDYVYTASLNADWTGTNGANKIGVVFNYSDSSNYYEVLIDMLGNVALNRVSGGARTTIASAQVNVPGSVPGIDQWFDVKVLRSAARVSVVVGPETAISNVTLPAPPPAGRIGVFTHYNHGRFDNVSVGPNSPPLLTPIFKTGFGSGVSITTPIRVGPAGDPSQQVWQVDVAGTETATGTAFRPSFWGVMNGRMMNTILPGTENFDDYLAVSIKTVAGPTGASTRVLSNTVKNTVAEFGGGPARLGLNYGPADTSNVPNKYYIRRYLKYSSNLQTSARANGFFVQHEFKNQDCTHPRRLILYWQTDGNRDLYYWWRLDKAANCPGVPDPFTPIVEQVCRPGTTGPTGRTCPAPPLGQWFYDEYFAEYSGGAQDRLAYAINGQVIFDYRGPIDTRGNRGIKLTPGYLDIASHVEIQADDLEVFSDIPCANFPCGAPQHY